MDSLNEFISKHRHLFDQDPLPEGHEERFFQKLPPQSAKRINFIHGKTHGHQRLMGIAASVALLLITGIGIWKVVLPANTTPFAIYREQKIEAKILQKYQNQVNIIEQRIKAYASDVPLSDWEQIEYTLELLAQQRNLLAESLPPEIPFALRLAALEAYYSQNLSGFQQIADLLSQNH